IPARSSSAACAIPIGNGRGGGFRYLVVFAFPRVPRGRQPWGLHLYLALRQKTCTLGIAGQFLRWPAMSSQIVSSQTMPSEIEVRSNRTDDALAQEEDARLRTDIRLLGRILGDTVRDQEGADVFDLVERIRQTSIRFHRDEDKLARRELETILYSKSTTDTVRIVRAFSYFSHLANIAEDQNNIRQMRGRGPGGPRPSLLTQTLSHAKAAGF